MARIYQCNSDSFLRYGMSPGGQAIVSRNGVEVCELEVSGVAYYLCEAKDIPVKRRRWLLRELKKAEASLSFFLDAE